MKVDILTLCDSANEYNGKLVIVGTFNTINAKSFPITSPGFAIVARVLFEDDVKDKHQVTLEIRDKRGISIIPPMASEVSTPRDKTPSSFIHLIYKGANITIPSEGEYNVVVTIDGIEFSTDLLAVLK